MAADLEPVVYTLRAGPEYQGREHARHAGAMYDFAATVIVRGDTAEIIGATGAMTLATRREIKKAMQAAGIRRAFFDRYAEGKKPRRIWID